MEVFSMNDLGERQKSFTFTKQTRQNSDWQFSALYTTRTIVVEPYSQHGRILHNRHDTTNTTDLQWQIRKSKCLNKRKKFSTLLWKFLVIEVFSKREEKVLRKRQKIEFYMYKTDTTELWLQFSALCTTNDNRSRALFATRQNSTQQTRHNKHHKLTMTDKKN